MMPAPAMLLALLTAALGLSPAAAAAAVECREECGGVKIPYPFGIGRGCYLETTAGDDPFNVTCSNLDADGNPQPVLIPKVAGLQVLDIDVNRGRMRVYSWVSSRCRNATSPSKVDDNIWGYDSATFSVSGAENVLTVVGCDVLAYIGTQEHGVENRYVAGCNASCPDARGGVPPAVRPSSLAAAAAGGGGGISSCDGTDGCCQTMIPPGIRSFYPIFGTDGEDRPDGSGSGGSPCRYAFLVEKEKFKFQTSYTTNRELDGAAGKRLPLMLDWAVGNKSCPEAQKDKATYGCRSDNHRCEDSKNGPGYLCKCKNGYRGNAYRLNGCQFIDTCKEKNPCHASAKCVNTEGSPPKCLCPRGRRKKDDDSGRCEIDYSKPLIGSSVGVVVLAVVLSCTYAVQEKKRLAAIKKRHFRQHGGLLLFEEMKQSSSSSRQRQQAPSSFTLFTEKELEQATDRFDERHVLGKGGNGTVYRGDLRDGRAVAIKRCRVADDERQRREFGKEVLILSQVNHRNIVKLYGCCLEVAVPMLVYQFIPNGTLYELLHGGGGGVGGGDDDRAARVVSPAPSFTIRLKIAHEAAEALAYLHSTASPPIIHGDVKSANILLDENYAAKVSDFGASVLAPPSDVAHLVTLVQGTCGYLDPEYMQTCRLTDRSDVYSFGVVLLELLTRRRALALAAPEEERSLAAYFLASVRDGRWLDKLLDAGIRGEVGGGGGEEVLGMVANLAKRCLEMSGERRPPMREVAEEIGRVRKLWRQRCFGEVAVLVSDDR